VEEQQEKPNRVFIDQHGKFYAAPQALHPSDAESTFPTPDMIEVLSKEDRPISRDDLTGKIIELGNTRMRAVFNPVTPSEGQG
jgi:hypothetical protein